MLIGLAAKNGILIVEFANQLRDRGIEFHEAVIEAAAIRLRPVLMTSLCTVFGAIPLLIASGAGAESRKAIGAVVVYGVMFSLLLTLYVVPVDVRLCRTQHALAGIHRAPDRQAARRARSRRRSVGLKPDFVRIRNKKAGRWRHAAGSRPKRPLRKRTLSQEDVE